MSTQEEQHLKTVEPAAFVFNSEVDSEKDAKLRDEVIFSLDGGPYRFLEDKTR